MRARGWVVAGAVGAVLWVGSARPARAEPTPKPVDIKAIKPKLIVLQDAHGGTYVVLHEPDSDTRVFFGAGKTLYEQRVTGGGANGSAWSINVWAPLIAEMRPASIELRGDGTYFKACDGKDDAVLAQVTGDKAKAILDKDAFVTTGVIHVPHLLARDDAGVYYYVDRLAKEYGGNGYRVFVGRKGGMKQLALTDVASDSAGQIFSTKTGDLRLVKTDATESTRADTAWVKGEKKTGLIKLDLDVNSPLIFRDLGIYKFTGTMCANL